jgi:hypothetical protein
MTAKDSILSCFGMVIISSYHFPVNGRNMLKMRKKMHRMTVFLSELLWLSDLGEVLKL